MCGVGHGWVNASWGRAERGVGESRGKARDGKGGWAAVRLERFVGVSREWMRAGRGVGIILVQGGSAALAPVTSIAPAAQPWWLQHLFPPPSFSPSPAAASNPTLGCVQLSARPPGLSSWRLASGVAAGWLWSIVGRGLNPVTREMNAVDRWWNAASARHGWANAGWGRAPEGNPEERKGRQELEGAGIVWYGRVAGVVGASGREMASEGGRQ